MKRLGFYYTKFIMLNCTDKISTLKEKIVRKLEQK